MLLILFKIVLYQGLFLLLYELLFKKETFYTLNRFYLLSTSVLAILVPFLSINILSESNIGTRIITLSEGLKNSQIIQLPEVHLYTNELLSFSYIVWFYSIITFILSLLFLWKLVKLFHLIRSNNKHYKKGYILVELPASSSVFSFLRYVFVGKEIDEKENQYLLNHEKIHIQQFHSLDLLWFELMKIILWFNPFIYLYQKRISALHEFIADAKSVQKADSTTYYNHLLNDIFQIENMAFVNQFYNKSLIQKRIIMMKQKKSTKWKLAKYLVLLPLLIFILIISCENPKKDNKALQEENHNSKTIDAPYEEELIDTEAVPFAVIDELPIFPGCEEHTNKSDMGVCLSRKIQEHVAKRFNVDLAQQLDLSPGKKRIFVMFEIDKKGNVKGVRARAPHKELEKEAIRVVKTLPKMKPGKQKGQVVSIKYSLPISFIVQD